MIYFTLLTDKIPFSDANNFDDVKNSITKMNIPKLPPNTPKSFLEIIEKCWEEKPERRILPLQIAEKDPWNSIFREACFQGQTIAKDIWKEAAGDEKKEVVDWPAFKKVFYAKLYVNTDPKIDEVERSLKTLLRVSADEMINLSKFTQFATTFSPLREGGTEGPAYIASLKELCKQKYFFGIRDRNETHAILNSEQAKKLRDKGDLPFIVRLSEGQNYQLVISHYYRKDPKTLDIAHQAISPDQYAEIGFLQFIDKYKKANKLAEFDHPDRGFDLTHKKLLRMQNNVPVTLGGRPNTLSSTSKFVQ